MKIDLKNPQTYENLEIPVIKSGGHEEPFTLDKITKMGLWAANGDEYFVNELLSSTVVKFSKKGVKTSEIQKTLVSTGIDKISKLEPEWEYITAKLHLAELYKKTPYEIKGDNGYPHLSIYVNLGLKDKILDREMFDSYSDADIDELSQVINHEYDYKFTFKALKTFAKYMLKSKTGRLIELPQFTYMGVAMATFWNYKTDRIAKVKQLYLSLANQHFTLATPIMLNCRTKLRQYSSCVLMSVDDDTRSIKEVERDAAIYSKGKAGLSLDIDRLREKDAYIDGNGGHSSGPVPFIKDFEATMRAWNQGSTRPGAMAIYFSIWSSEFPDLIMLKNNGGTDDNRARHLKYAVKIPDIFIERLEKNETWTLLPPSEAQELLELKGDAFRAKYLELEDKIGLKKNQYPAKEIWKTLMKERTETGNIYIFFNDTVNRQSPYVKEVINSSNLCCEITEATKASRLVQKNLKFDMLESKYKIDYSYESGEVATCNLASVNLEIYEMGLTDEEIDAAYEIMLRAMDQYINNAEYQILEAKVSNHRWRYIGIGVSNYAKYLAIKKAKFDSAEAVKLTSEIFEDWSYRVLTHSVKLSKEFGPFPEFKNTKWADGWVPMDDANPLALQMVNKLNKDWLTLKNNIARYGVRFGMHFAIAPTQTSGLAINATNGIDPIFALEYNEESNTGDIKTLAPDFRKLAKHYRTAFDIDQTYIIYNAAVRQVFMDQSQSVSVYCIPPFSLLEQTKLHLLAHKLGLKTLYYFNSQKPEEVCESCT